MVWWKKLLLGVLSPLFITLLFATALDVGFVRTATHPATVKKIVADSGISSSLASNLVKQASTISTPFGDISTNSPAVQQAANQVISPTDVQKQVDGAIDSVYQWLDGKIAQPQFNIGLAGDNAEFATNVSQLINQRLAGLPTCSTAQSITIIRSGSFDAVNSPCLPRGLTAANVADQVKTSIIANPQFFKNASINADSLGSDSNNQTQPFFEQSGVKNIPKQYQRVKKTPFILSLLTILTCVGIVLLSRTWQAGLRHIGINLVVIGLLMLVFSWALNRTVNTKIIPKIDVGNTVLNQDMHRLVSDISQQVDKNYWIFGGVYTMLGVAALAGGYMTGRKTAPSVKSGPAGHYPAASKPSD